MWRTAEALRVKVALARCTRIGPDLRAEGVLSIDNQGTIVLGRDVALSAVPIPIHLAAGPHGVLRIGDRVRIAHGAALSAFGEVVVEDDVTIEPLAMILDIDFHEIDDRSSPGVAKPVRIGRGAWIGAGAVVLRGVVVGEGARVAPNSVVSRHVPPGAGVRGVPARPFAVAPRDIATEPRQR